MVKNRKRMPLVDNSSLGSSLGDAFKLKGFATSNAPNNTESCAPKVPTTELSTLNKLVLRRERKGRGGKTVTIISGFAPSIKTCDALESIANKLRKVLGCGATVESDTIVLQGDQRDRAADYFRQAGVSQIVET